ncbi:TPA: hypothetical protein DIC40_01585 [Patescibacteria group bacterium]|nr:hypothetical protein [Candidatus Gracilibacteria bacterium]
MLSATLQVSLYHNHIEVFSVEKFWANVIEKLPKKNNIPKIIFCFCFIEIHLMDKVLYVYMRKLKLFN